MKPSKVFLKQITARLISNQEVMPGVYLIWLEAPQMDFTARQKVDLSTDQETVVSIPFSPILGTLDFYVSADSDSMIVESIENNN